MKGGTMARPIVNFAGLAISAAGLIAAALSGPGYRWGWWDFRTGFSLLRWAAYLGAVAATTSLVVAIVSRPGSGRSGFVPALAGLLLGLALFGWPASLLWTARQVPAIHDISTDTAAPPEFAAILPLRAGAPNQATYGGSELAAQQHAAYPDMVPLRLAVPTGRAFARARNAVRELGWTVVAEDQAAGRIEAFDKTLWYGFVDDIVVRIEADGAGSRIDVRSVSRLGKSDIGTNARRIRKFLRAVERSRA
jgi:uncharacterized protein (DUF1499 family)